MNLKAKKLTKENFEVFGHYACMENPVGPAMKSQAFSFYRDPIRMHTSGRMPITVSPLVVNQDKNLKVPCLEYHTYTPEVMIALDDDFVLCLAPAYSGSQPKLDEAEAFILPRGTAVHVNPGVWHYVPLPLTQKKGTVLIILPERTYENDLIMVDCSISIEISN